MSHPYAQHAHPKAPAAAIVPAAGLLDYEPEDDTVYKRRYFALKNLVHALEDENNMIALKLAQITVRCRDAEVARLRQRQLQLDKSHPAAQGRSVSRQASQASQAGAHPSDARIRRSRSASTVAGAHSERRVSGKRAAVEHEIDMDSDVDLRRPESRLRGYSDDEDRGASVGPAAGATAHRALEDLMDEPSTAGLGAKPRSKGSAAAINDLIDDPEVDDPRLASRTEYASADPRRSVGADTDSQMDMDADDY